MALSCTFEARLIGNPPSTGTRAQLIVNTRARRFAPATIELVRRELGRRYQVEVVTPRSAAALVDAVAAADEHMLTVIAGGDGTLNRAAAAAAPDRPMGIIPLGTANDFARELGISRDPVTAARAIVAAETDASVDLLVVNGRRFCTVGGLGLVTRTTTAVLRLKQGEGALRHAAQTLGSAVYKVAAAAAIVGGHNLHDRMHVRFEDIAGGTRERSGEAHALFVANHRMCGGGLCLPTGSSGRDGVFELGIVHRSSRVALAVNFSRLSSGRAIPASAFEVLRARAATITLEATAPFVADGEVLDESATFDIRVLPGALCLRGARAG